jgi:LmbE family N-acetylglucosaminyl deacetylase
LKKVLLSVLAHPDDESFGMGGTLAKYAEEGVEVHLICATRGEAGEVESEFLEGFNSIADLRVSELNCAIKHLGLSSLTILNYRDSGMTGSRSNQHPEALINAPIDQVAAEIAEKIRELKPQVILTFDPMGGYKHPDHIFIHQAASKAFHLAGDPSLKSSLPVFQPRKLFFHTFPKKFIRINIRLLRLFGRDPSRYGKNNDIDLTQLAVDFPVHVIVSYSSVQEKRIAAAACHASQGGEGLTRGLMRWISWLLGVKPVDQFMQGYPEPMNNKISDDLFEGI